MTSQTALTAQLADLVMRPVSDKARERACLHLLDWAGCVWAGSNTDTGRTILRWARGGEAGRFSAIACGDRSRDQSVLVNGGLGNILEMDDLHRTAILHPGPVVIPAALAAAVTANTSGSQFLDAIVRGYEAMIRVGRSLGPGHYQHWHNTGTAGPFGAAGAAGSVFGLTAGQLIDAFGNAGTQSAGLWQTRLEPSMSKQLHTGRAAHAGLMAAEMAASGFTGAQQILEGVHGLYQAMCPDPQPSLVCSDPDADWQMWDVSFKPWPACRHAHPTIDAALLLRDQVVPESIASVQVHTYDAAVRFCDNQDPQTELQARFSLQHLVGVSLMRGEVAMDDCLPDQIDLPALQQWRKRVTVHTCPELSQAFPQHYGARLVATLTDGSERVVSCDDALGDPDQPLSSTRIVSKACDLQVWAGRSQAQIDALSDQLNQLPGADSIDAFINTLCSNSPQRENQ